MAFSLISILIAFSASAESVRNSVKSKDFPLPMNFDVVGHGLELTPLVLNYDLESSKGEELKMGNFRISPETVTAKLVPAYALDSHLIRATPIENLQDWVFTFQWPEEFLRDGVIEVISRTGRVLWSTEVNAKSKRAWQKQLNQWKMSFLRKRFKRDQVLALSVFKIPYGVRNITAQNSPFWDLDEPIRFCFSHRETSGLTRLCTTSYEVTKADKKVRLDSVPSGENPPSVLVMNEAAPLKNEVPVTPEQIFQFSAELRSGMSFEFSAVPEVTRIVDLVQDKSGQFAWLTTESDRQPLAPSVLLNQVKIPEWVEWIGWQQTIGDFRKYWRTKISFDEPYVMLSGAGGGVFEQKLVMKNLPREELRPYLEAKAIRGTYIDGAPIRGRKRADVDVSTDQNSVTVEDNKTDFVWKFGAPLKSQFNRSYLMVKDGDNVYPAYHEVYRGYNREVSARLSGILGGEDILKPQFIFVGELAFNNWFEDIFGLNQSWTRQKWGASLKVFRTFNNLNLSNVSAPLSSDTAEIKYRFNQGLWARDETWGLLAGYQNVGYDMFQSQMLGGGFFWARSMPRIFENLFDWFSFLDYPKWVDLEFIYYAMPLESTTTMAPHGVGNWALNFHGQIMFTDRFFGEAGFGLKQYDFGQPGRTSTGRLTTKGFSFTSSYGTVGLGYKF